MFVFLAGVQCGHSGPNGLPDLPGNESDLKNAHCLQDPLCPCLHVSPSTHTCRSCISHYGMVFMSPLAPQCATLPNALKNILTSIAFLTRLNSHCSITTVFFMFYFQWTIWQCQLSFQMLLGLQFINAYVILSWSQLS